MVLSASGVGGQQNVLLPVSLVSTAALTSSALGHWLNHLRHRFRDVKGTINGNEEKTTIGFVRSKESLADTVV